MAGIPGPEEASAAAKEASQKAKAQREALIAQQQAAQRAREEKAAAARRVTRIRQTITFSVALAAFVVVAFAGIVLRDYRFSASNGQLQLVARISIGSGGSVTVDNSEPGKLTLRSPEVSGAVTYEYQVSRFRNMLFGHTYRSDVPRKTLGMLSEGKTYYVRVRAYKVNASGRQVHGAWGTVKSARVKETK